MSGFGGRGFQQAVRGRASARGLRRANRGPWRHSLQGAPARRNSLQGTPASLAATIATSPATIPPGTTPPPAIPSTEGNRVSSRGARRTNRGPRRYSLQDAPASLAATSGMSPAIMPPGTTPPTARSSTLSFNKSQDFDEALKLRRVNDAADRRDERNHTPELKKRLAVARKRKMVSAGILHDAPKSRRQSSDDLPLLTLVPGAPLTPPPRIPQPWEASSNSTLVVPVLPLDPPSLPEVMVTTPTTSSTTPRSRPRFTNAPPDSPVYLPLTPTSNKLLQLLNAHSRHTTTSSLASSKVASSAKRHGFSPTLVEGKVTGMLRQAAAAGEPAMKRRKLGDAFVDRVVSSSPKPGKVLPRVQGQIPQSHVVARVASSLPGPSRQPKVTSAKTPQHHVVIPASEDDDDTDDDLLSVPSGFVGGGEPRFSLGASREAQIHSPHLPSHASKDVNLEPRSSRPQIFDEMAEFVDDLERDVPALFANVHAGSGDDEDDEVFPGNLAQDFHAEIPEGIPQRVLVRIMQVDAMDDLAIRSLLTPDDLLFDWQNDASAFRGQREVFTGVAGPTFPYEELASPVDSFLKIWDAEIVDLIVRETNCYAEKLLEQAGELKDHSRLKKWYPVTREELLVFFAVLMVQANYPLPVEKEYFYNSFRYAEMPLFRTMMSYDRFILIKKFLHFVSGEAPASATKEQARLYKIQPILDYLQVKFQTLYMPEQEIAVDESLLKWMGRLSFAQKITTKAAERGVKSNEVCESSTGYLWSFKIYAGKCNDQNHDDEALGMTAKIVHDLVQPLFGKGHTLVMDNFYNSPLPARCLKNNATDVFGTLRINREFVPQPLKDIAKTNMRIGEVQYSQCHDMSILLWCDSNLVAMISTYHPVVAGVQVKYGVTKYKPQVVLDYNSIMGGIDKKDQLLAAFPMERDRNRVWYKKLFRRMLNVSILNAMVMFRFVRRGTTRKDILHRQFREELVIGLLAKFQLPNPHNTVTVKARVPLRRLPNHVRPILVGNHFVVKTETGSKRRCVICTNAGLDHRTAYQCNVCLVPLCLASCFMAYHTDPNQ